MFNYCRESGVTVQAEALHSITKIKAEILLGTNRLHRVILRVDSVTTREMAVSFAHNRQQQQLESGRKKTAAVGAALPGISEDAFTNLPHPHGIRNVESTFASDHGMTAREKFAKSGKKVNTLMRMTSTSRSGRSPGLKSKNSARSGTIAGADISKDMRRLRELELSQAENLAEDQNVRAPGLSKDLLNYTFDQRAVSDLVGALMEFALWKVMMIFFSLFMLLVFIFAMALYLAISLYPDSISTPSGSVATRLECLWLSLQTFTTVGYGSISPTNRLANFLTSLCAFVGQLYVAVLTAVFLAHLMTPYAHWKLSDIVCIRQDSKGRVVLEARFIIAPKQVYYDVECFAQVEKRDLAEEANEGYEITYFNDLPIEADFSLLRNGVTYIRHVVDQNSGLADMFRTEFKSIPDSIVSITIKIQGKDPRLRSLTSKVKQFRGDSIRLNEMFKDMTSALDDGRLGQDCSQLSETVPAKTYEGQKCTFCGNVFNIDSKFCRKCGKLRPTKGDGVETDSFITSAVEEESPIMSGKRWTLKWEPNINSPDPANKELTKRARRSS